MIGVDTTAVDHTGRRAEVSKLTTLPHLQGVLTSRGLHLAFLSLSASASAGATLEELLGQTSTMMEHSRAAVLARLRDDGTLSDSCAAQANGQTYALVAWDSVAQCVRARIWNGYEDPGYAIHDLPAGRSYRSPDDGTLQDVPCTTPAEMETLARLQVERFGNTDPNVALGGSLIVARVSAEGIKIQKRCRLLTA